MKQLLIVLALPVLAHVAYGQAKTNPNVQLEEWNKQPALHKIDSKYSKESAVVLMDIRRMEYVDEGKNDLAVYRTLHKIIHVNDDKGIESFNRVYLGVSDNADIVDIRARTILPGGKIIELDKANIKDMKEEDGNMYKIFAMEGLEKGCEVEYYYTYKREASFFGRETLQGPFPILDARVQSPLSPQRLVFDMKGYNCSLAPTDTVIGEKRWLSAGLTDITGAEEEKYAASGANMKRLEYKLSHNTAANSGVRLFTWNDLAKRAYTIYTTWSGKKNKKDGSLCKKQ